MQYFLRVEGYDNYRSNRGVTGHSLLIFLFPWYCEGWCVFYSLKFFRVPNKVLDDQLFHNQFCSVFSQTAVTRWIWLTVTKDKKGSYSDLLFYSLSTSTKYAGQQSRFEGRSSSQVPLWYEEGLLNYTAISERYLHVADFNWANSVTIEITRPCNRSYMTVLPQTDGTKVVYKHISNVSESY